jgi:hypothetical protein
MIFRLPSFDRAFSRLTSEQQSAVRAAIDLIRSAFGRPHLHSGIGIRPFGTYFECRSGLGLRILFLVDEGDFTLATVGTHDHVRAYLRNNR